MDYWRECVDEAFADAGIEASEAQRENVAGWFESAHSNYGMAFGNPSAGERDRSEIDDLKRKLRQAQEKVPCHTCNGRGRIITPGPYHSSDSQCWKCHGEGRLAS